MNPVKQQVLREEVQYLLDNDFIEPSQSEWNCLRILVSKPDGTFQFKIMPFGRKNSPAAFQRLVNTLNFDLAGCKTYINHTIIFSKDWG